MISFTADALQKINSSSVLPKFYAIGKMKEICINELLLLAVDVINSSIYLYVVVLLVHYRTKVIHVVLFLTLCLRVEILS